jgi:hypothetical protein
MMIMVKPLIGLADYARGFPSPDDVEMWKFLAKKNSSFHAGWLRPRDMTRIAWSQRMLIH